jgi:hypothetical protein
MKKTTQKWRLTKLPTPEELTLLVKEKILSADEAKNILLSNEEVEEVENLKQEIKFLKELVEKLSNSPTKIIETIREVQKPIYIQRDWYKPYEIWCGNGLVDLTGYSTTTGNGSVLCQTGATTVSFSNIN